MSNIPYNYGSYIDSKVAMTDNGTVDAGKQMQSPASAGSRGMAKTMQFSKDKTQMQMGNSPIAESMIEIRSILNRIDGVNVPVQEEATIKPYISMYKGKDGKQVYDVLDKNEKSAYKTSDERLAQNFFKKNYDKLREAPVQEDAGEQALANELSKYYQDAADGLDPEDHGNEDHEEYMNLARSFKKGLQSGMDAVNDSRFEFTGNDFDEKKDGSGQVHYQMAELLKKYNVSAGIKNSKSFLMYNGKAITKSAQESAVQEDISDKGRIALEKAGFDPMKVKEYMAVFNDHGDTSDIDQMNMDKVGLADAMAMVLASHDVENESYQPMPEGDEFDIEEDEDFEEVLGPLGFPEDETELFDAEYQGRKVPLNKPMRGDVKKFKVYVKDPKSGNVKKVNFGHGGTSAKRKTMRIRKSNPKARKSFRARHNCANPGPKTKARYWSCRKW